MRTLNAQGLHWLMRGKEGHRVDHQGTTKKLDEVVESLTFRVSALGEALAVRLIAVQLSDEQDNVLGRWTLLTNVGEEMSREEVAQWYYWRVYQFCLIHCSYYRSIRRKS